MFSLAVLLFAQSALQQAEALLREHKLPEAKAAVSAALADTPQSVPALMLRGRIAMAESDFDTARDVLTRAAALAADKPGPQFLLGFFHYVDNDFVRARPVLERARRLAPRDAQTALFLALTYDGLARPDLARPVFEQTIALQDAAGSRLAFARMLYAQGLYAEAETQVRQALQLEPDSRDGHYEQARLHFAANRFPECIAEAERALQLAGDGTTDRSIYFLLSRAYDRAGDKTRAAENRRRFEAIPPRLIR